MNLDATDRVLEAQARKERDAFVREVVRDTRVRDARCPMPEKTATDEKS